MALGLCFIEDRKFDLAELALRHAVDLDAASSDAYWALGSAEEADYQYAAAEKDYSTALALAPDNQTFRSHLAAFKRMTRLDSQAQPIR